MAWGSASSARGTAKGTASRSLLTRHTRADTVGTQGPSRTDGTQGGASGREAPDAWRGALADGVELCIECARHCHGDGFPKLADQAHKSRYCRHARAESRGRHTGTRVGGKLLTDGVELWRGIVIAKLICKNLRSRHVRRSPAKLLLPAMEGCHFQKAERKLPLQPKSSPIATEFVPARTQRCGDDLDVAHQNSSREDPPEYASAAWDHWTGRDCASGRPSRSLCLDLTSGPPLGSASSALAPDPLSMDTESPIHVPRRA